MDRERRGLQTELRAHEEDDRRTILGYAAVFNSRTDIGPFTEEIAQDAFADVLDDDVRALFNHSPDFILGRSSNDTLRLFQDDKGLRFEVDLNTEDPDAMALYSRIKRGDITGNSFSFTVDEADEELGTKDGKRHRVIRRVAKLFDVGPVTFPAYEATVLSARCEAWEGEEAVEDVVDFTNERERLRLAEAG